MFGNDEFILIKYKNGRDLDLEDTRLVDELCLVGMMKKGIRLQRNVVTAKTLPLGLKLLNE
ncbi:MAG: hypothetical protein WC877_01170 [Dehalococcoidales bacterium]|jgi:hypothetical protein